MNFDKQVAYQKEKYDKYKLLADKTVDSFLNSKGIYMSDLLDMADENNTQFVKLCTEFARTLIPGTFVKCTAYACAVASIFDVNGITDYKLKCGFCLPKSNRSFEETKAKFEAKVAAGEVHPFMVTHLYLERRGKFYECYDGETRGIEHFDCIEL